MKDTGQHVKGSALRALDAVPPFTEYHFVELDPAVAEHLKSAATISSNVSIYVGDCNQVIPTQVLRRMSRQAASLAFLDPTGLQLHWETVRALAEHRVDPLHHRKMELLLLYPYDMAIDAKLFNERVYETLTRFFGGWEWHEQLEQSRALRENINQRRARFVNLYCNKLRGLGYEYVEPYGPLYDRHKPLYYVIFATDFGVAQRIMSNVWTSKKARMLADEMGHEPVKRPRLL